MREIIFFLAGKTHNGTVLGIFRGGLDLFDPKIALRVGKGTGKGTGKGKGKREREKVRKRGRLYF